MSASSRKDFYFLAALFVLTLVVFGANLGGFGLLDPDEPFYCLTAKEMLQSGRWSTPIIFGAPQFEKPIFFYWVLCALFKGLGISEFSARLGSCVAGILIVLVTYLWARALFRRPVTAFISAAILATAAEYVVVSRVVLTDIYLCLFVTAALYAFSLGYFELRHRRIAWHFFFVFSALGFLTKGLLGVLLPFMAAGIYLWINGELGLITLLPWASGGLLFALIALPWYLLMTVEHGVGFLSHFFIHENVRRFFVAEHGSFDRFYFYPAGLFFGFYPWSFVLPFALVYSFRQAKKGGFYSKQFLWLWVCLASFFVFFTLAKSKLLSYIFPVFPVMALIAGGWAHAFYRAQTRPGKSRAPFLVLASAVLGAVPAALAAGVFVFGKKVNLELGMPVVFFSLTVLPLSWTALFCLWKDRLKMAFFLILSSSVAFSVVSFGLLLPKADTLFASRDFVETFKRDAAGEKPRLFIAGKLYVRGVSFYSDHKHMAVLTDDPRGTFYTRHSIPMISSTKDLLDLAPENFPAYCFLRRKEYIFLKTIVDGHFKMTVLDDRPQRALVRLDRA